MTQIEYLDVLILGYIEDSEYLENHIYRQCLDAEKNNIDYVEFFDRLLKAFKLLANNIDNQYFKAQERYYQILNHRNNEGKSIEGIEKPNKDNIWVQLNHLSNCRYLNTGLSHLTPHEVYYISNCINSAWKKIREKKEGTKNIDNENKSKILTFRDAFKNEKHYQAILNILSDQDMIDRKSLLWKDSKKGAKSMLIAITKKLKEKGYFKKDIVISNEQHVDFAKEFGIEISIQTAKRSTKHDTDFIPYPTDLD